VRSMAQVPIGIFHLLWLVQDESGAQHPDANLCQRRKQNAAEDAKGTVEDLTKAASLQDVCSLTTRQGCALKRSATASISQAPTPWSCSSGLLLAQLFAECRQDPLAAAVTRASLWCSS
jgi:hypothetical protein